MTKNLFVYGTLMQGMRNHHYMESAKFIGPAKTEPEFELLFNGSIPAVRAGNQVVIGELYEVTDDVLKQLDVVEEVNDKLYERQETKINGEKAIIYIGGPTMFGSDTWQAVPGGDYHALVSQEPAA